MVSIWYDLWFCIAEVVDHTLKSPVYVCMCVYIYIYIYIHTSYSAYGAARPLHTAPGTFALGPLSVNQYVYIYYIYIYIERERSIYIYTYIYIYI